MGTVWDAVNNFTWMPVNIHRLVGNIAFGGSIVAAYAAFRFLVAKTKEDKAHYDWDGVYRKLHRTLRTDPAAFPRLLAR